MSSTSKNARSARILRIYQIVLLGVFLFGATAASALAANSLSVSVTPPLFQLTIGPGESWSSSVKVVNNNPYDVTYYTQVVDFEPQGEDGTSTFTPLVDELADPTKQTFSLASWIRMSAEPVLVRAGASAEIPFSVQVPDNAEPGGHYGAILVGTQPGGLSSQGAVVKVSSFVSSLLFVRIKGDVVESGRIREFTTPQTLYDTLKADFMLRFENTGNTHIKPQGDITIYNMWGKERGKLAINQESGNFGNVLPKSIRKFAFAWEGDDDPFDIGPYSAVVTLAYGEDGKQNVSAKTYFWIVPIVPVAIGLSIVAFFLVLMTWLIRRYIRRSLALESARLRLTEPRLPAREVSHTIETFVEPLREGVIDLRSMTEGRHKTVTTAPQTAGWPIEYTGDSLTPFQFIVKYKLFLLFLIALVTGSVLAWNYFDKVLVSEKLFEIRDVSIHEEAPYFPSMGL